LSCMRVELPAEDIMDASPERVSLGDGIGYGCSGGSRTTMQEAERGFRVFFAKRRSRDGPPGRYYSFELGVVFVRLDHVARHIVRRGGVNGAVGSPALLGTACVSITLPGASA